MRADHAMSSDTLLDDGDTGEFSDRNHPRRRREIQSDLSFASSQEDTHLATIQSEFNDLGEENEDEDEAEEEDSSGIASTVRLRGDLNILLCGDPG